VRVRVRASTLWILLGSLLLPACSAQVEFADAGAPPDGGPCPLPPAPDAGAPIWRAQIGPWAEGATIAAAGGDLWIAGTYLSPLQIGSVELTGGKDENGFVARISQQGEARWARSFDVSNNNVPEYVPRIAVDREGDVFVADTFVGTLEIEGLSFSSFGGEAMLLARLDGAGNLRWAKAFDGASAGAIAIDPAGGLVVAGTTGGSVDLGGGAVNGPGFLAGFDPLGGHVFSRPVDAGNLVVALDSAGAIYLTGANNYEQRLAKFDATGAPLWSKSFKSYLYPGRMPVVVGGDGTLVLTGTIGDLDPGAEPHGISVAKLDADGGLVWSKGLDGATSTAAVVDACGDVILTGDYSGTSEEIDFGGDPIAMTGQSDMFLLKLDRAGKHVWSWGAAVGPHEKFFESSSGGAGLVLGERGDVLVTGSFQGTVNLGGEPMTSSMGECDEIFLASFVR
jgi:hypothetical protein